MDGFFSFLLFFSLSQLRNSRAETYRLSLLCIGNLGKNAQTRAAIDSGVLAIVNLPAPRNSKPNDIWMAIWEPYVMCGYCGPTRDLKYRMMRSISQLPEPANTSDIEMSSTIKQLSIVVRPAHSPIGVPGNPKNSLITARSVVNATGFSVPAYLRPMQKAAPAKILQYACLLNAKMYISNLIQFISSCFFYKLTKY